MDREKLVRSLWVVVPVAGLLVLPLFSSGFHTTLASEMLIMALFAIGFNLVLGQTGMVSFGHAAYFGLGAYTTGLLLKNASLPLSLALPAAPIFSAVAGLGVGYLCVRLTRIYFAMLTLAFSQIFWVISFKWYSFTGGDDGLVGVPIAQAIAAPAAFYYFTLAVSAACVLVLWIILNSPFGHILRTIRESPERARAMGVYVRRYQLIVFVLSAFFSGLAGGLYTLLNRGAFPDFMFWTKSADVILMTLLGGMYSFIGPAVGAGIMVFLHSQVTIYWPEYWSMVLGLLLIVILLFFRGGIMGFVENWDRVRAAKKATT
jgi:branched-chain amino acid transport system permease protein